MFADVFSREYPEKIGVRPWLAQKSHRLWTEMHVNRCDFDEIA